MRAPKSHRIAAAGARPHGIAPTADGKTLYVADWAGNLVVFMDATTMQTCGYVQLHSAEAVAVVPGAIPNVRCASPVP